eukprot:gb/GEZJ01003597.1/.p1 GENE.gb/GEZJ01003597.1/~~gb/GEZJ01003597.1/.p1  ORF type:complete len:141 (+),score=3.77 gb/GEZJ01003597.1/:227-649(+)
MMVLVRVVIINCSQNNLRVVCFGPHPGVGWPAYGFPIGRNLNILEISFHIHGALLFHPVAVFDDGLLADYRDGSKTFLEIFQPQWPLHGTGGAVWLSLRTSYAVARDNFPYPHMPLSCGLHINGKDRRLLVLDPFRTAFR